MAKYNLLLSQIGIQGQDLYELQRKPESVITKKKKKKGTK